VQLLDALGLLAVEFADRKAVALDVVMNTPRPADIDVILSNSFGFGGHNGSVVFRRYTA